VSTVGLKNSLILHNVFQALGFMVFNATFKNISVLLVDETGVPGENHRPAASH
jgi:hypothetical protein